VSIADLYEFLGVDSDKDILGDGWGRRDVGRGLAGPSNHLIRFQRGAVRFLNRPNLL